MNDNWNDGKGCNTAYDSGGVGNWSPAPDPLSKQVASLEETCRKQSDRIHELEQRCTKYMLKGCKYE
jgi:hypothetical protein